MASNTANRNTSNKNTSGNRSGSNIKNRNQTQTRNARSVNGKNTRGKNNITSRKFTDDELMMINVLVVIGALFVCVILFLCNFGKVGVLGEYISKFMFALFGWTAYVFPILLLSYALVSIIKLSDNSSKLKMIAFSILFLSIGVIIEMFSGVSTDLDSYDIKEFISYGCDSHKGGGIIAGSIGYGVMKIVDKPITVAINILLVLVSLFMICGRWIINFLSDNKSNISDAAREVKEYRREQLQKKKEQQEDDDTQQILRMDNKYKTISKDIDLKKSDKNIKRDDIHEIILKEDSEVKKETVRIKDSNPYDEGIRFHIASQNQEDTVDKLKEAKDKQQIDDQIQKKNVASENIKPQTINAKYKFPPITLLSKNENTLAVSKSALQDTADKLVEALESFGVSARVTDVSCGPSVTRYELEPAVGVKVSRITSLADDLKLHLAAKDLRIEAPIPGKSAVGIEVPNKTSSGVRLRELLEDNEFKTFNGNIAFAIGKDISGKVMVSDISKMPHMLIAGSTGSGKSVCINTIIMSVIYKHDPKDVQLILVDPKVVELNIYNGIPHLMIPVVTDPKKAAGALHWAVNEMTERYRLFAQQNVRDLKGYNSKIDSLGESNEPDAPKHLPQILIIVDELADLMMVAAKEVEEAICRLAQLARACGIHLILATQRPSVDVITGLIKANMPSRVAFAVSSGIDSRTIIDMNGAEKLLGKGDMLFYPQGYTKPARMQGAFVSDEEVAAVVEFIKNQNIENTFGQEVASSVEKATSTSGTTTGSSSESSGEYDELFVQAAHYIFEREKASIGDLQRRFRIGFTRGARIMDQLCEAGVVGEEQGTKPREILMDCEQFDQYVEEYL